MNLLDDSLATDLASAGSLNDAMVTRLLSLAQYAKTNGAHGILFTCSAFGPAIDEVKRTIGLPALKPNEAMFDEALDICAQLGGARRIGLLTTFAPAVKAMHDELQTAIAQRNLLVQIDGACALGAMEALNAGDAASHDRLILEGARTLAICDMRRAAAGPVLDGPGAKRGGRGFWQARADQPRECRAPPQGSAGLIPIIFFHFITTHRRPS